MHFIDIHHFFNTEYPSFSLFEFCVSVTAECGSSSVRNFCTSMTLMNHDPHFFSSFFFINFLLVTLLKSAT